MAEDGADKRIDAPRGWKLGLRVASGVALLAMVVHYANPRALLGQLSNADPLLFVAAVMVAIAANVASALRWAAIARALDLVAPRARLIWMYARGITVNVLLPGATLSGDLLRSYQLSRLGNPLMRSALSVFFDRFSGLWVLCAMSLCATLVMALVHTTGIQRFAFPPGTPLYALALAGVLIAPLVPWPIRTLRRIKLGVWGRLIGWLEALRSRLAAARPALARSLGMSFVVQALSAATLWICALSIGMSLSYWIVMAAAAPIFVMAALPIGVAGFGTRELAAVAVFGALGISADQATAAALLFGLCVVVQGVLAAPLFLLRA